MGQSIYDSIACVCADRLCVVADAFWDADEDDDDAFEKRVDDVCREIGNRGRPQLSLSEAVPPPARAPIPAPVPAPVPAAARAPAPAPAPAAVRAPAPAPVSVSPRPTPRQDAPTPSMQTSMMLTTQPQPSHPSGDMFAEMVTFMREEREHMKNERADMHRILQAQREEVEKMKAQALEVRVRDTELQLHATQVAALQARLAAMHAATLLADAELFALEDGIVDALEARSEGDFATRMVALSCTVVADAAFSRQLRRKFI
jgi:hypothetical protein